MSDSEELSLKVEESAEEYTGEKGPDGNGYLDDAGSDDDDDDNDDYQEYESDGDDEEDDDEEGAMGGEYEDHAIRTFDKHNDIVYCIKIDPVSGVNAVTGGKDDHAYVWNVNSGEILHQAQHTDTVTCVEYSFDGCYLAIGDMSGFIDMIKTSDWKQVCTYKTDDIEWMKWHHSAHVLMTGNADGTVYVRNVPGDQCKVFPVSDVPIMTGLFLPDGVRACTGDNNGTVKIWDIKTSSCLHSIQGADTAVVCMDSHPDNVLLMTGSEDAKARLINTQNGKIIEMFQCGPTSDTGDDSVEVVGFSPTSPMAATGTLKGSLFIWDIQTCVRRESCLHPKGITKLIWEKNKPIFYTACLDGILRLWDARTGQTVTSWKGHRGGIMDFDISKEGSLIVSTSTDRTARVFSTHQPQS